MTIIKLPTAKLDYKIVPGQGEQQTPAGWTVTMI